MDKPVAVAPKIDSDSAAFYRRYLPASLNQSVAFILDAFPVFYQRTLEKMRGVFSIGELGLILDALNGHGKLILTLHHAPALIGQHVVLEVSDMMRLSPGAAEKWEISDHDGLIKRLSSLTVFQQICLEVWASGFWNQDNASLEEWVNPLLRP